MAYPAFLQTGTSSAPGTPPAANVFPDGNFTFEACLYIQGFFNPGSYADSQTSQIIALSEGPPGFCFFIRALASGAIEFQNYNGGANFFTGAGIVKVGRWFHLAVVYDWTGRTYYVYINGQQVYQTAITVALRDCRNIALGVATSARNNNNLIGAIDEARMWPTARTPAQISANWNRPNAALLADGQITAATCVGCWDFDTPMLAGLAICLDASGRHWDLASSFSALHRGQQGPASFLTGYLTTPTTLSTVS